MEGDIVQTMEDKFRDDERFTRLARWSQIPMLTYSTHRLYNFVQRKGTEEAYQAAVDFSRCRASHHFLTFIGETGAGKTHLALGIAWHWMEQDKGLVMYYQVEALLDELRSGFHVSSEEAKYNFDQLMKWVKTVSLLVLDDLGVEQSTKWARAKLDEIIDHRYINQLPMVVTTNLKTHDLEPRIASRLSEGQVIIFKCDDYRRKKRDVVRNS